MNCVQFLASTERQICCSGCKQIDGYRWRGPWLHEPKPWHWSRRGDRGAKREEKLK